MTWTRDDNGARNKARVWTPEMRAKMSASKKGQGGRKPLPRDVDGIRFSRCIQCATPLKGKHQLKFCTRKCAAQYNWENKASDTRRQEHADRMRRNSTLRWADPRKRMHMALVSAGNLRGLEACAYLDRKGRQWRFKSPSERLYAEYLDREGLTWMYERCALLLSDGESYVPDFWVGEWQEYVELKESLKDDHDDKAIRARLDGHSVRMIFNSEVEALCRS